MSSRIPKGTGVDPYVGLIIRHLRTEFGLSQTDLADRIGVSFQQVQKYETGKNKVSLNRLCQIAAIFKTDVSTLLKGIEKQEKSKKDSTKQSISSLLPVMNDDERRVLKSFRRIKSRKFKRVILLQLRAFLDQESKQE